MLKPLRREPARQARQVVPRKMGSRYQARPARAPNSFGEKALQQQAE